MVALFSASFGLVILHKCPVGGRSKANVFMNCLLDLDQLDCWLIYTTIQLLRENRTCWKLLKLKDKRSFCFVLLYRERKPSRAKRPCHWLFAEPPENLGLTLKVAISYICQLTSQILILKSGLHVCHQETESQSKYSLQFSGDMLK